MTKQIASGVPNIFPFLRYDDAATAIEWLVRVFGFDKRTVVPGPDGSIAHAELWLGTGAIMLGSAKEDALGVKSPLSLAGVNQGIYVFVPDVEGHHARARAGGAEIVRELARMDYGSMEYSARDLERHLWSFGTYLPE